MGQLAKKLEEKFDKGFGANTEANPKEECKVITTRSGKVLVEKEREDREKKAEEVERDAIIQKLLPPKFKDPGSFTIPCTIGTLAIGKALIDLGASINLMPLSMFKKIGELELKPSCMTLQLAYRSIKYPHGVVKDVLVKVDKFLFPVDFVIMEMEEDIDVPLILGRPFMKIARVLIDVDNGKLKVRVQNEEVDFNVFEAMSHPNDDEECFQLDALDEEIPPHEVKIEDLDAKEKVKEGEIELKMLSSHLKYVFLEEGGNKLVIINNSLSSTKEEKLIEVLKAK
ncbi:uncharacterized protein LOC106760253 [Vigna radiata var. radiata]|uniref:Uncharacterized protein LOC106760253 n=1 Tax=Vigna radiata var. radiata TaxID=3916 RepID=A0A1S3TZK9_VIGRR|nr:uncharacterized protein LOC106760253 [Vigna radiata var. radiata]